jgi:hypothetical protein
MGVRDIKKYHYVGTSSIPASPVDTFSLFITLPAGLNANFNITTTPLEQRLSIWNFTFTVCIDSLNTDSEGFFQYQFPNNQTAGHPSTSLLSNAQQSCRITNWTDWATSSDIDNIRNNFIRLENLDSGSHDYYLFFKAYTSATTAQGS